MSVELEKQKKLKEINKLLETCTKVKNTIDSPGWKEIVEPMIDKMISDITGAKTPNGRWYSGLLDKARKDEKREFYIGYKQALIDLHRRIYGYNDSIKRLDEERTDIVSGQTDKFMTPLVDDTRYGREFSNGSESL